MSTRRKEEQGQGEDKPVFDLAIIETIVTDPHWVGDFSAPTEQLQERLAEVRGIRLCMQGLLEDLQMRREEYREAFGDERIERVVAVLPIVRKKVERGVTALDLTIHTRS